MFSKVEQQLYAFNELELIKHIVKPGLKWICTTCTGLIGKTWTRQKKYEGNTLLKYANSI